MDYVVGSVAALISGNVTPNRPRLIRRALTPTKHQPSPNVTPKSEVVDDRSIFLSPTLQKKKAIVKKSPKRIFQNPDLDATDDPDSSLVSPKAEKVKKHLKDELEADSMPKKCPVSKKSLKNKKDSAPESEVSEIKVKDEIGLNLQFENESTPKKKKKKSISVPEDALNELNEAPNPEASEQYADTANVSKSSKKLKQRRKSIVDDFQIMETDDPTNTEVPDPDDAEVKIKLQNKNKKSKQTSIPVALEESNVIEKNEVRPKKKNKKQKNKSKLQDEPQVTQDHETDKENNTAGAKVNKKKKRKNKKLQAQNTTPMETDEKQETIEENNIKKKKAKKSVVNPNAITYKDSDSEHESDDEIQSDNEEINKRVLETKPAESSSDEEEENPKEPQNKVEREEENDAEVLKRTLFVGNVPFSSKCKKEIKKIFKKHGKIETVRIRTVPVKDARTTPKLAVIKKELHPERSTVNVYIKYADPESVDKALCENNTVLNEHHLRVSKSDSTGAQHDPRCSVFLGNLPFKLEEEALRTVFEKCGEIHSIRIIRDKKTNAAKGFGYVNFISADGVELALALSDEDLTIKNRIVRVKRCTPNAQKGKPKRKQQNFGKEQGDRATTQGHKEHGAFRRIANKRKNQDGGGGPPDKRQKNIDQPSKEKKARKEFVGMTAEKKKKRKFDKGQKKKKALGEILTK